MAKIYYRREGSPVGFFRKDFKGKKLGFIKKRLKAEEEFNYEYEYCKIFVELCESISHAGGQNSRVAIIWNNETNTLSYTVRGDKAYVEREYANSDYYVFRRLYYEVSKFKSCKLEKSIFL